MLYRTIPAEDEGWVALAIAILCRKTADNSFRTLSGEQDIFLSKENRDEEMKQVALMREDGCTWQEVGDVFGMKAQSMHKAYKRWLEKR